MTDPYPVQDIYIHRRLPSPWLRIQRIFCSCCFSIRSTFNERAGVLGRNERPKWEARYKDLVTAADRDKKRISSCGSTGRSAFWPYCCLQRVSKREVNYFRICINVSSPSLIVSSLLPGYILFLSSFSL